MPRGLLRVVYVSEFLLAILAIFTAWSEIGGQGALDAMPWSWKGGLCLALAASIVGFTAALESSESFWTLRSARWCAVTLICALLTGMVTYYYSLQVDTGDSEEGGTISRIVVVSSPQCLTV
jgi:hypothetical protein